MSKIRVAVIFGGPSDEYNISLKSATSIINNIPKNKYEVVCIGITKLGHWLFYPGDSSEIINDKWKNHPDCTPAIISPDRILNGIYKILSDGTFLNLKIDCVFPVLHGKYGEDGCIQGLLELSGIPYVGNQVSSSAVCMDKSLTHTILDSNGIKTADWVCINRNYIDDLNDECNKIILKLKFPMFIKPSSLGSSIAVNRACNFDELKSAIKFAFAHDNKVIIEKEIIGKEVECAVLGTTSPITTQVGEIVPCNKFYDYESKYVLKDSQIIIPARVDKFTSDQIRKLSIKAFKILNCSGLARVDFFVTDSNDIILNEINTMPGFTDISMYSKLWEHSNLLFSELISELIQLSFERFDL